jgi:YfiH family protein
MFPANYWTTILSFRDFFSPHVVAFVTDRSVDFRMPDEPPALSSAQREFLLGQLGFNLPEVFTIRQVHGNRIVVADPESLSSNNALEEADGIITDVPGLPIAVRTADCLPVFIYDPRHEIIGLIHAGWRGTSQQILNEALGLMRRRWHANPADLRVAFGPAIRVCCYQVGQQFREYFPEETVQRDRGYFLDLSVANKNQLLRLGVDARHIFDSTVCTCCDSGYFSYRREGEVAGRMLSLMMLKKQP